MSPIAHSGMALLGWQVGATRKNIKTFCLFLLVASLSDFDFLLFFIFGRSRISVHQYFTHNLFFIVLTVGLLSLFLPTARDRWSLVLVGLSHLVLDIIVIDPARPIGIRPFFPFLKARINLGFFPYMNHGHFHDMFSRRNIGVFLLEAGVFVLPVLILSGKKIFRNFKSRDFWTL